MDSLIIFGAKYLFLFVVLIGLIVWLQLPRRHKLELALALIVAVIIAVIIDKIAGWLYYDPRPFTNHSFKPLVAHTADNGFPSEHTLYTFMISAVIYAYRRNLAILAAGLALLVGISRVAAYVHSPIDIIGGIIFGIIAGYGGYRIAPYILSRLLSRRPNGGDGRPANRTKR